jgi:hypothetical protein
MQADSGPRSTRRVAASAATGVRLRRGASRLALAMAAALLFLASDGLRAQQAAQPAAAPAAAAPAAAAQPAAAPTETAKDSVFSREEIRKLVAPYALYPDPLLAQLLPACAYPIDIVQVSRWLAKNKAAVAKGDLSGLDQQGWDPTVKALARFPDVIDKLNADLDATTDLGDAFVNQPNDVADVIQELRREAQKAGSLKTTKEQRVSVSRQGEQDYVAIEPADPGVIYVPTYDPYEVYSSGTGWLGWGLGVAVGIGIGNYWDWGRGWVYPPRWPGYPGYRPNCPGCRPANLPAGGNINIGNDINIGNGNLRPWRPDSGRYRPGQGSKPGLARPSTRPSGPGTGANRPGGGAANRPQVGGGPAGATRPGAGANRPGGGANRPSAKPGKGQRPAAKKGGTSRPKAGKPARNTAFGDARLGGASNFDARRGAASRASPVRYGGGPSYRGGGGYRGGGFHGGGGGRRFSGGGGRGGGGRGGGRGR